MVMTLPTPHGVPSAPLGCPLELLAPCSHAVRVDGVSSTAGRGDPPVGRDSVGWCGCNWCPPPTDEGRLLLPLPAGRVGVVLGVAKQAILIHDERRVGRIFRGPSTTRISPSLGSSQPTLTVGGALTAVEKEVPPLWGSSRVTEVGGGGTGHIPLAQHCLGLWLLKEEMGCTWGPIS